MLHRFGRSVRAAWHSALLAIYDLAHKPVPSEGGAGLTPSENQGTEPSSARLQWIRYHLQRCPYWAHGHAELAREAILRNDIALAYPSALAVRELSPQSQRKRAKAHHLLGICFLRKSSPQAALEEFERAEALITPGRVMTERYELLEDKAAALMALGRDAEAERAFEEIPAGRRTADAEAARQFLKGRAALKG